MKKYKLGAMLVCYSMFALYGMANAIVVLDPGQLVPVPKEISNGIDKVGEVKRALTSLKENLSAIGDKVKSISEFNKDNSKDKCNEAAKTANENVTESMKSITLAQSGIADILKTAKATKQDLADGIVIQTEELINTASTQKDGEIKANILANFENVKELGMQLAENVNEAFDTALNTVNQNAQKSHEALMRLSKVAMVEDKLNAQEQDLWRSQDLSKREQFISDEGINMIEKAHEQYNREYKEKFSDELNNYQKVVIAYAEGNANKEDVISAGEQFKLAAASLNVLLNEDNRESYEKKATEMQHEVENATNDIIQRFEVKQG